jgi:hypothetical protein
LPRWEPCLFVALFALLPLSRIWMNLPLVDQSGRVEAEQWGRAVLALPLAEDATILADGEKFAPLYYLQQVEGQRVDLDLVVHFEEAEYRADLLTRLEAGQTVYLARYLPGLETYFLRSVGSLVEVGAEPLAQPPPNVTAVGVAFGGMVELLAFQEQGEYWTLYWRALERPEDDLEVRLRLVDSTGGEVWARAAARPVGGNYPTNAWPAGVVVPDAHSIVAPYWLEPGRFDLQVALFPRFSEEGLVVEGGTAVWWTLAPISVEPVEAGSGVLPMSYRAFLGEGWLEAIDAPSAAPAGSPLQVDLAWAGVGESGTLHLEWWDGETGHIFPAGTVDVTPGTAYSRAWLTAPDRPGRYELKVGWEGKPARCRWLAPATSDCSLAWVQIEPAQEGMADFDGRILLLAAELGAESLLPGGSLPVVLHWRGQRSMAEDFTVTVQLLGPDGRLHSQVDAWPVQGTLPTSHWVPGQEIDDPYQLVLSPDAPPGRYQVVVGWYLLATMERLPVVDGMGNPIADHAVIGEVEVTAP